MTPKRALTLLVGLFSLGILAAGCSTETADDAIAGEEDDYRTVRPAGGETLPELSAGGFSFGGFEYWPYKEAQPLYPDKIQWGFEAGSPPARQCMAMAARELHKILQNPPASLLRLKEERRISSFFNWNNDYTGAERDGMGGHRKLWLYNGSLIKWISETNTDGRCRIPSKTDLDRFARACLAGNC